MTAMVRKAIGKSLRSRRAKTNSTWREPLMAKSYGYTVVIPTSLNNHQFLHGCLKTLREHSAGTVEIIVILNGAGQDYSRLIAETCDARVIEVETRVGYAQACNLGIAAATGQYVVISNDDVLFAQDWNVALRDAIDNFPVEFPECPPAAIVGPASNNVAGVQQIPDPQAMTEDNYLEAAASISTDRNWVPSTFISGFCMMISREFIELMGGAPFDESLVNGAEDNLLCLEAMVKGFSAVACGNSFVFHFGSRTTDRLPTEEVNARGVKNLFEFYQLGKALFTEEQKVAACCRVRLLTADHLRVFKMAVKKNVEIADALVVLNDRSVSELWTEAEVFCKEQTDAADILYVQKSNSDRAGLDEYRDRQWMLTQARELVGELNGWYLSFDADEVWEKKLDREYLQRLIHHPHPSVCGLIVHFYTFWDETETMWRKDGIFGSMAGNRIMRMMPGHNMMQTDSGMHMGNVPMSRVASVGCETSVRVKHYGFSTPEERQRKYAFYTEYDTVKNPDQIGAEDYRHLIDTQVALVQWEENTSVTIGTCMFNEEIALHNWLQTFWAFADKMIVCDTGSADRTVDLLKMWGVEVIDFEDATGIKWDSSFATASDLGMARNLSMHAADTHWYWQIDPDEYLRASDRFPHPMFYIRRLLDRVDLDAVQFFFRCIQPDGYHTLSQTPRLVSKPQERAYFGYVHETLDRDLPESSRVAYAEVDFVHTGGMLGSEAYADKMRRYFRGNLRMVRDYPDEARGWFNASLHFLDSEDPAMRTTGLMFMHQAQQRNPRYAVVIKEICVQAFTDLGAQLDNLLTMIPEGHPFHTYTVDARRACTEFGLATRDMIRCPGHAAEVLAEPAFAEFLEIVQKQAMQYAQDGDSRGEEDTTSDVSGAVAV